MRLIGAWFLWGQGKAKCLSASSRVCWQQQQQFQLPWTHAAQSGPIASAAPCEKIRDA
jgi:hypothetical protein